MATLRGKITDVTHKPPESLSSITVKAPSVRVGGGTDLIVSSPATVDFDRTTGDITISDLTGGLSWLYLEGEGWSDSIALSAAEGMISLVEAIANASSAPGIIDYLRLLADFKTRFDETAQDAVDAAAEDIKWERRLLGVGEDIFSLTTAGVYTVHDLAAATSLVNRPTDPAAQGPAIVEVLAHPRGIRNIRWHSLQSASSGLSGTWATQQDTAGNWAEWRRVDGFEENRALVERGNVPEGADLRELDEGDWKVYSSVTANSLVNAPPQPQSRDTSLITVRRGGRDLKIVTWTAFRPSSGGGVYSFQTHQDSGGAWSEWTQIWPTDAPVTPLPEETEATTPILSRAMWDYHLGMRRTQLDSTTGEPLWGWAATEGVELNIPTHEGSGQACHPSVVHIPEGWNGYKYWMAMTPYPFSAEEHEDPDIIASHDGTTWEVPEGLTNPLDDQSGRPNAHNSDTYLDLGADGVMRVIWRTVDRPNNNHNYFYMRTSTDGVTWTPKQIIYDTSGTEVSPTITWTGTAWRMYYCRSGILYYRETANLDTPAWSNYETCATELPPGPGRSWWHMDIQYAGGAWWCLMQDRKVGSTLHGDIYLWRSQDGRHWDNSPMPLISRIGNNYDSIYKSALLVNGEGTDMTFDVFYSTYAHATREWAIRRTSAKWIN